MLLGCEVDKGLLFDSGGVGGFRWMPIFTLGVFRRTLRLVV